MKLPEPRDPGVVGQRHHNGGSMSENSEKVAGESMLAMTAWILRLRAWWRERARRRYWTAERQLEHLRQIVQDDHRWLAHDKVADALTTRYLAALAPDWMIRSHAHPDHFRREVGLEPPHAFKTAEPAEVLARARLVAAYAAFSAGHLDDAFDLFNEAGNACAEACRAVGRISAARKEQR